jgi:hypothetical protein
MLEEKTSATELPDRDERTRVVQPEPGGSQREAPLGPREAFLVAYERLALLAQIGVGPAFVVAAVDPSARVTASLRLQDRRALIVGRHSQCGLLIDDDTVSLRHVAALVRSDGARPILHVRDLATNQPFVTEDGAPNGGVIADGPLYIAIGNIAIWFLPCPGSSFPSSADEAWQALAPRTFLDRRSPSDSVRPSSSAAVSSPKNAAVSQPMALDERTHVTQVAAPLLLGEDDDPEIAWGTLKISHGARREKRAISAERLEQGILLGRYGRCSLLLETTENTVSRVHVLLLRLGAEVWILDTASTHGVKRGEDDVAAEVLRDADTLTLSREITIGWEKIQHAEA